MKELNYRLGLDRLYNVVWAIFAIAIIVEGWGEPIGIFSITLIIGLVIPFLLKKVVIWVAQGFLAK